MAIKEWTTHLPTGLDNPLVDQPNLINDIVPGDNTGDLSRVSQIHTVRDIANYCANKIGSNVKESGTVLKRLDDLESSDSDAIHANVSSEIHGLTNKATPVSADELVIEDSAASWAKKRVAISSLPTGADEKIKVSSNDTIAAYGEDKIVTANGLTRTILNEGVNEQIQLSPTYGSSANTVCQGNDSRLSDNRTDSDAIHKSSSNEISSLTEKGTPISADLLVIEDSAASYAKKKVQVGSLPAGVDTTALHKATASEIHGLTNKASPVSADELVIEDSADSWNKKKVAISSLPAGVDTTAIHKATASEIHGLTNKASPVSADELVIEDSADSWNKKKVAISSLPTGADSNAIHVNASSEIHGLTNKATPVGADELVIEDSAASWVKKRIAISTLPSGGGGFSGYEQEFTAAGGDEDFTLTGTPATNANMLSGYTILGVFRNGARLRYRASPSDGKEYGYTSGTKKVNCKTLTAGDIITVVYGV